MHGNQAKQLMLWLAVLVASPALGSILYVDKNSSQANDSNPGTEALPLRTIDRAMAVVQPGDHVYVKGGANATDPQALYDRSARHGLPIQRPGTAAGKIVVEAYPGQVVVLQGDGTQYGIALDSASYYEIRGFLFRNFSKATEGSAVKTDILLEKCEFTVTRTTGLRLRNITNLTLRDVNVHHCFEAGIYIISSSHVRLERVISSFNDDQLGADGDGDGIDTVAVDDFVAVDCTTEGNSEDGFDLNSDGSLLNCVAKNNNVCGVKLWRRSEDGYKPRKMMLGNCLVFGHSEAGIKASVAAALDLFNSVVYGNGEEGVAFRSTTAVTGAVYSRIFNTIIAGNGANGIVAEGTTVNVVDAGNNLYYQNTAANSGLHSDAGSLSGQNPLFVDPASGLFQLRAGSPAVDRGMIISGYHCSTAGAHPDQNLREWYGSAPDIGAYEVGGAALSPITNLSVSGTSQNSVSLAWTVPGDPLLAQKPTSYDIRYADGPLTETNWAAATQAPNQLAAGNFGQAQSFTLTGLSAARTYYIAIKTMDGLGNTSGLSNVVSAVTGGSSGNHAPVLATIGDKSVSENQLLTFTISATDADGNAITYAATGLPGGATLTGQTFRWTPTYSQAGSYSVTFTAGDGQAQSAQTITIAVANVNRPPILAGIGARSVTVGSSLSFTVSATDPDGGSLTYAATPLPGGATLTGQTFAWTPASTQAGSYTVTFTVSDGTLTDSESVAITVNGTDPLPPPTKILYVDNTLASDCRNGEYSIANRSNSGRDGNAYRTMEAAATAAVAGDTIYLRAGTYRPAARITVSNKAGTSPTAQITFANYNSELTIIDGSQITLGSGYGLIDIQNSNYVVLQGLKFQNSNQVGIRYYTSRFGEIRDCSVQTTGSYGIHLHLAHNTVADTLTVTNSSDNGIRLTDSNDVQITHCAMYHNVSHAIYLRGASRTLIEENELYDNYGGVMTTYHDTPGITANYNVISNNLVHDNVRVPENSDGISVSSGSYYTTVSSNILYGNADDGLDVSTGGGASGVASNLYATITGNLAFGNGDGAGAGDGNGIKVSTNNGGGHTVAANVAFDNERAGFDQDKEPGYPQNFFYQNLAYNNPGGGFLMDAPSLPQNEDAILYNNIAVHNGVNDLRKTDDQAVSDSDYNWWGDGVFVAGRDAHSRSGDPQFVNPTLVVDTTFGANWSIPQKLEYIRAQVREKFRLQASSLAVDHGRIISGYHYSTAGAHPDQNLQEWYGSAPDMGANEVVPSPIPAPNPIPTLSPIADLSVSGTGQNSVSLAWTVPGDPLLTPKPTAYDIRHAGSPLTDTTWAAAVQVPNQLPAGDFGEAQFLTITGLSAASTYYIAIRTTDGLGNISPLSNVVAAVTGAGGNHAPVLAPIGDKSVNENQLLTFAISATDADGNPITYTATSLPGGATLTGPTFRWTPTYSQAGSYSVTFTAGDGQAQSSQTIAITVANVDQPPVLAGIGAKSVSAGSPLSFTVSATDPDGDNLTYSASPLPSGAGWSGQTFAWTPAPTQAGSYTVTFTVSDGALTDSESATITVVSVLADQRPPAVGGCLPAADTIQVALNNLVTLHVTDADSGVNANSVVIRVDGSVVYQGNVDTYTSPTGRCSRCGTPKDYRFIYQANALFDFDQTTAVRVNAADLAGNVMSEYTYGFTTQMRAFGRNQSVSTLGGYADSQPATTADPAGNLWVAWHAGTAGRRDIYVAKRPAGAGAFQTPVRLTSDSRDQCNPDLAVSAAGAIYVVWQDNRNGNWDLYASISSDGGNFSSNVRVTNSSRNEVNPALAVDRQTPARVYVAWQDDRNGNQDIYVASSTNAFANSTTTRVTSNTTDQTEPDVAVDSGNVAYVFWTDLRNGQADIYAAASSGSAGAWANVPVVARSGAQTQPAVAAGAAAALHLLWVDNSSGNEDVYYAALNGLPGSPVAGANIVDDSSGADQAAPALVCGADQRIFACWTDWRHTGTSDTDTDLYMTELRAGTAGTNIFIGDDTTNANQGDPALGVDRYGEPYVVWTDYRKTAMEVYCAATTLIDPQPVDSKVVVAAVGATIGTAPAAINGPEDVSVVVPAGASQADLRMTISDILNPPVAALPLLGSYEFGPSGVNFDQPMTVTIPYAVSRTNRRVLPYWYDSVTQALSQEGITDVQNLYLTSRLNALQFRTTHFTPFYLVEADAEGVPLAGGSSGGGCALAPRNEGAGLAFFLPYLGLAAVMVVLRLRDRKARRLDRHGESAAQ